MEGTTERSVGKSSKCPYLFLKQCLLVLLHSGFIYGQQESYAPISLVVQFSELQGLGLPGYDDVWVVGGQSNSNLNVAEIESEEDENHKEDENHGSVHWEYTGRSGTEFWGSINPNCLGTSQSPVNMDPTLLVMEQDSSKGRIQFVNYDNVTQRNTRLENNGHTVQLNVLSGNPTMFGGHLGQEYEMAQLHFHWGALDQMGSEHTIDRRRFPLEMHMVHLASDSARPGLAVAGFVFDISYEDNPDIEAIIEGIRHIRAAHSEDRMNEDFKVSSLISRAISGPYFSYSGSLTTPGCNEGVQWILFSTPLSISSRQVAAFRTVFDDDGEPIVNNFRPVQRLNDRTVMYHNQ